MKQEINGIKIYEIDTAHVDAYIHEGSTTMKFITLEDFKKYVEKTTTKTTTKKKTTTKTTTKKKKVKK